MKFHCKQSGFSLYGAMFWILMLSFVAHTTFKLFPVYMEDLTVKSIIDSVSKDPDVQYNRPTDVQQAIFRRFGVNNVSRVTHEDVSVVRDGEYFMIDITYEVRMPYLGNVSLVAAFSHQAEVRGR